MKLILHDYRRCPFCIRVRILLELKNIPYEHVHEPLREWTSWMREHIEKPRVPVLRIMQESEKEVIKLESNDINLWLDANFGEVTFTPKEQEKVEEMNKWFDWCAHKLKPQVDLFKYGQDRIFDEQKHVIHTKDLRELIQTVEDALSTVPNVLGVDMTLADIALIPFIRQIMRTRNGEFDFSDYPRVLEWSGEILNQDWFNDIVMAKK